METPAALPLTDLACPRCGEPFPAEARYYGPCPTCARGLRDAAVAKAAALAAAGDGTATEKDRPLQGQERAMNG